ncbi:MAG: hypothetical protein HC888_04795 [Candidatus Competibacteraceae bacterium]|nr:hypothetical protein [Candidatus Competibacteraceae bacterium]
MKKLLAAAILSILLFAAPPASAEVDWAKSTSHRFDIYYMAGESDPIWWSRVAEELADHFYAAFPMLAQPEHRLRFYLFADKNEYLRFAKKRDRFDASWTVGYFSVGKNFVAVHDGLDDETDLKLARHEAAHQLSFNSGLQKSSAAYPFGSARASPCRSRRPLARGKTRFVSRSTLNTEQGASMSRSALLSVRGISTPA